MKIKNIKINAYGTLEQKEFNFGENINIIYGKNESGKSTLLNYIKSSFYGISRTKNKRDISDYDKYKPWYADDFSGKITYELDNGEEYQIYRDFKKKTVKIYNEQLEDITNQFETDKKEGNRFFVEQTNMEEDMFLSTIVSMQGETKLSDQDQAILVQKLANLTGSGNDNISYKKIIEKLNKKQLEEIGTERTLERPINLVNNKLIDVEQKIKELKIIQERKNNIEEEKELIKNKIKEKEIKLNIIKEIENYLKEKEIKTEKINLKIKEKKEINEEIKKIKTENNKKIENNKNKNKKNQKKLNILLFFIMFIDILSFVFLKHEVKWVVGTLIALVDIILILVTNIKIKAKNQKIKNERTNDLKIQNEAVQNQIEYLEQKDKTIQKEIEETERWVDEETEEKIQNMNQISVGTLSKFEILELFEKEKNHLQKDKITDELNEEKVRYNSLEQNLQSIKQELEKLPIKEEERDALKEEKAELEEKNRIINLTKDLINKAYEQMQKNVTPKLTNNLSKNVSKISNGKYQKVVINPDNKMLIEDKNGEYIPVDRLSIGTIDQMYLALRLSMTNELALERMPIFLDETFAYFDEERLKNILAFLSFELKNNQVFIFTCSDREMRILEELSFPHTKIKLD